MTEAEVGQVVLETVRKYTMNDGAAPETRFEQDLRLGDAARQMLFASLAQAFSARGVSLPSHQFYLSDFVACPTPAAAAEAIRGRVFGTVAPARASAAPAPKQAQKSKTSKPKPTKKPARPPKKSPAKKSRPAPRKGRAKR